MPKDSPEFRETGWPRHFLFATDHCGFVSPGFPAGSPGRAYVPAARLDEDASRGFFFVAGYHAGARADDSFHSRAPAAGIAESTFALDAGSLLASAASLFEISQDDFVDQFDLPDRYASPRAQDRQPIHASSLRGLRLVHAHGFT